MKQLILGFVLGTLFASGLLYAQETYWQMTPFQQQNYDRQRMLEYNLNRAIIEQQMQQQARRLNPC